ncbi:cytochrome c oxidase assembly protein [Aureimonas psammosilenae]|uniref:cytochrome c oxidase assembly protein n=1 Tax=Aureimonas psammosilenae TaxID=2495496 RepID=UPI001260E3D0|nr:cytochrome c oxidase assembly protein [Aureimonas psammosilenae]
MTRIEAPTLAHLWPLALGLGLLAVLWLGPLPSRARGSFSAHMVMHMGIVAVAAPLLALGVSRLGRLPAMPVGIAVLAAFFELVVVWGWHAPALHDAARVHPLVTLAEQGSFLLAGLFVWVAALGGAKGENLAEKLSGAGALLLTSMHMTLLGALLLFAPRPLYACADLCSPLVAVTPLEDQAAGGAIMLSVGGLAYLLGGLVLVADVVRDRWTEARS